MALGPGQDRSASLLLPLLPAARHLLLCAAQRTHRPRLPWRASVVGEERLGLLCSRALLSPTWVCRSPMATSSMMSNGRLPAFLDSQVWEGMLPRAGAGWVEGKGKGWNPRQATRNRLSSCRLESHSQGDLLGSQFAPPWVGNEALWTQT